MKILTHSAHKVSFAKALRRNMTKQEKILWEALRRHNLNGVKFKRQVPIGNFVVDFYCHKYRLIIEIDGGIHNDQKEYDVFRQELLELKYYTLLRFANDEIDHHLSEVLKTIAQTISPSPQTEDHVRNNRSGSSNMN